MIKFLLEFTPQLKKFPINLWAVTLFPHKFWSKIDKKEVNIEEATIFLFISIISSSVMHNLLFFKDKSSWLYLTIVIAVFTFGTTILCGIVLCLSWSIVGANIRPRETAILYFYHSGVWNIFNSMGVLILISYIMEKANVTATNAFLLLLRNPKELKLFENDPMSAVIFIIVYLVCLLLVLTWGIGAWRAYNKIYKINSLRVFFSFILYCSGCFVLFQSFIYTYIAFFRS